MSQPSRFPPAFPYVRAPSAQRTDLPLVSRSSGEQFVILEGVFLSLIPRLAAMAIDFRQLDGRDLHVLVAS